MPLATYLRSPHTELNQVQLFIQAENAHKEAKRLENEHFAYNELIKVEDLKSYVRFRAYCEQQSQERARDLLLAEKQLESDKELKELLTVYAAVGDYNTANQIVLNQTLLANNPEYQALTIRLQELNDEISQLEQGIEENFGELAAAKAEINEKYATKSSNDIYFIVDDIFNANVDELNNLIEYQSNHEKLIADLGNQIKALNHQYNFAIDKLIEMQTKYDTHQEELDTDVEILMHLSLSPEEFNASAEQRNFIQVLSSSINSNITKLKEYEEKIAFYHAMKVKVGNKMTQVEREREAYQSDLPDISKNLAKKETSMIKKTINQAIEAERHNIKERSLEFVAHPAYLKDKQMKERLFASLNEYQNTEAKRINLENDLVKINKYQLASHSVFSNRLAVNYNPNYELVHSHHLNDLKNKKNR